MSSPNGRSEFIVIQTRGHNSTTILEGESLDELAKKLTAKAGPGIVADGGQEDENGAP